MRRTFILKERDVSAENRVCEAIRCHYAKGIVAIRCSIEHNVKDKEFNPMDGNDCQSVNRPQMKNSFHCTIIVDYNTVASKRNNTGG